MNEPYPPLFEESGLQSEPVVETNPLPHVPQPTRSYRQVWLIAGGVILFGVSILFAWRMLQPPPKPTIQVVESPTPSPTPIRIRSAVATQASFLRLVDDQASLSAGLSLLNADDPSLSPPTIELPLGFKQ